MNEEDKNISRDTSRSDTTSSDMSRPVATEDYYISVKEAQKIFIESGRHITQRTVQRYCEKQQLDGQKRITAEGEKWFVRRNSVFTRIKELDEFDRLDVSRQVASTDDMSPLVAEGIEHNLRNDNQRQDATENVSSHVEGLQQSRTTSSDMPRHVATTDDTSKRVETSEQKNNASLTDRERELYEMILDTYRGQITELSKDKMALQEDKKMLVDQLLSKDRQIDHFFSSERDTKKLFGSLQNIMTYLWPGSKRKEPSEELPQTYAPVVRDMPDGLDDQHR